MYPPPPHNRHHFTRIFTTTTWMTTLHFTQNKQTNRERERERERERGASALKGIRDKESSSIPPSAQFSPLLCSHFRALRSTFWEISLSFHVNVYLLVGDFSNGLLSFPGFGDLGRALFEELGFGSILRKECEMFLSRAIYVVLLELAFCNLFIEGFELSHALDVFVMCLR
jgi:hypothetical protein